jgi:signal transduction histidine kinase/CheY-like chemotaxis protein
MSQGKQLILALSLLFYVSIFGQKNSDINTSDLAGNISYHIGQAEIDVERGNLFIAEENLQKALDFAVQIDDKKSQGIIYTKMAKIHFTLGKYDKALSSLNKALEIQRLTKDYANQAETYNVRGLVYAKKNEHKVALESFTSARTYSELEELDEYVAGVLLNSSISLIELKEYWKATQSLERAIALSKKYKKPDIESMALIYNAKALFYLENYDKARSKSEEGLKLAKQLDYKEAKNEAYLVLSEIYQKTQDYKLSNEYLKAHISIKDSIYAMKSANLDAESALQYQTSDYERLLLESNEELKKAKKEGNLTQLISLLSIALITILSLLTLSLYKNNNIRTRTNNMLYKKNEDLMIAKEKAELASKTKANFLSTVTHELRTPLYAVTGLTNMLLDEDPKPEQVNHLKSLKFSGEYLLAFINDILQLNKIEAEKVNIEPEIFNLKQKIENVLSALNNSALDNNVKLHLEYDKKLPEVFNSDQVKISQILMNLVGNSIKFTKDGDIWVRVKKMDNDGDNYNIKFEVEDNGIGITEEKQEHLFESFSQGSIQINRKYGGTGLGLSIVKGLIDILKGKIYLKSELDKGTTFFFELPLLHSHEEIKEKKTNYFKDVNEIELSSIKILVVEDNKINQMITKKILNKMKLNCDVVDNGEDAVDKVKTEHYDVVLMDIHMPGISGIEATKMIRIFDKEITIFALTAVTLEDKMQEFDEAGFDDIISKPFKQEDFEKKLFNELIGKEKKTTIKT